MMRILKIVVATLALALAAPAFAQSQTQARPQTAPTAEAIQTQLRDMAAWSMSATQVVQSAFGIVETMPETPDDVTNTAVRREWIAKARAWSVDAHATIATAQRNFAALPAPPTITFSAEISQALREQHRRLPAVINGLAAYLGRYDSMLGAFERNDPKAMTAFAVNSIDAIILPIAHMRDINDLSASTLGPEHPQSHLLRSYARSYDALISITNLTKASIEQENPPLGFTIEEVDAAAAAMRRDIAAGRAAAAAKRQEFAIARPSSPQEARLVAQARRLMDTYPASFNREEKFADTLDRISRYLAAPGRVYDARDSVMSGLMDEIVLFDTERVAEHQARQAIVASE